MLAFAKSAMACCTVAQCEAYAPKRILTYSARHPDSSRYLLAVVLAWIELTQIGWHSRGHSSLSVQAGFFARLRARDRFSCASAFSTASFETVSDARTPRSNLSN